MKRIVRTPSVGTLIGLLLILLFVILFALAYHDNKRLTSVRSISWQGINIQTYREEDGTEHLFLPSGASEEDVVFTDGEEAPDSLRVSSGQGVASLFFTSDTELSFLEEDKEHTARTSFALFDKNGTKLTEGMGRLKGHGNTSFAGHPKKSLDLKCDEAFPFLGMAAQKKWILIANYADDSTLRNRFVYETALRMGCKYTPESDFVNVWYNGEYRGLYLLCHKVDVSGGIVGIRNLEKLNKSGEPKDTSGGYLMEFSGEYVYREAQAAFRTPSRYVIVKSPNNLTEKEEAYITAYVSDAERALEAVRTDDEFRHLCDTYLDLPSWTEQFWLQEFFCNVDAEVNSAFFYKEQGDDLLCAGPVWDMDRCAIDWADKGYLSVKNTQTLMIAGAKEGNGSWGEMPWLKRLYQIDAFFSQALTYYEETFSDAVKDVLANSSTWCEDTSASLTMDAIRWEKDADACLGAQNDFLQWVDLRLAFWADYSHAPEAYEIVTEEREDDVWRDLVYCVKRSP